MNKKEYRYLNIPIPDDAIDALQQNNSTNHIIDNPKKMAFIHVTGCCLLSIG